MHLPAIVDERKERKHQGQWLSFDEIQFTDPISQQRRRWEYVERANHSHQNVDAVEILAIVKRQFKEDHIILVIQYRPPTRSYCIELPAGLIDHGETVEQAAGRELKEETGYTFNRVVAITPTLFYEPGLTNSDAKVIHVEVDGDAPENKEPKPALESDEWSLKTVLLPTHNLYDYLAQLNKERGIAIDGKLYSFAYGLQMHRPGSPIRP